MAGLVQGKIALVTGAGSGIGEASAIRFAEEGAAVVVVDIDEAGAVKTAARITETGGDATAVTADVTSEGDVEAMLRTALAAYGRVDCAHNNAGITSRGKPMHEISLEEWARMITMDLTSVFLCLKHEVRHMLSRGDGGAIVNTASGAGVIGSPGLADYVSAKHGVLGLTKTAALEYVTQHIRVNAVCPGVTDTPMLRGFIQGSPDAEEAMRATIPGREFGRPEQVAAAVVWLCSEQASWVAGEAMLVDGASVCR
jgi:NAD(P)-dependent dehydrogenase (short-subunit alcohol dehydrogenase family)